MATIGSVLIALAGLTCGIVWLALLVATGFNVLVISAGLVGALYVTGRTAGGGKRVPAGHVAHAYTAHSGRGSQSRGVR